MFYCHGGCGYYVIWCVLVELVPVAGVMADGFDGVLPERLWLHFIHEVARLRWIGFIATRIGNYYVIPFGWLCWCGDGFLLAMRIGDCCHTDLFASNDAHGGFCGAMGLVAVVFAMLSQMTGQLRWIWWIAMSFFL